MPELFFLRAEVMSGVTILNDAGTACDLNSTATVAWYAVTPNAGYVSTGLFAAATANGGEGLARRNAIRTNGFNSTDLTILKNTRFGRDSRFNFQVGAEIFDLFNQRVRTITGVGAFTQAFAIPGNANFLNYGIGSFGGRTIRMRAKFIF